MPADLRIHLLGGFRAEVAGRTVADSEWRRSGATALVKILALHGRRLHRDQAVDLLWPEAGTSLGMSRLNKSLHFARRVLGSDRLLLREDMLRLETAGLWIDVDAFEQAVRTGDAAGALALYTGDLLPENRFDAWAESRRAHLRDLVVPLLIERGSQADLERVIELDPLREEAYARLIRLEADQGHRHLALRWYDRLAETLRTELGIEPNDHVQRLHAGLTAPGWTQRTQTGPAPGDVVHRLGATRTTRGEAQHRHTTPPEQGNEQHPHATPPAQGTEQHPHATPPAQGTEQRPGANRTARDSVQRQPGYPAAPPNAQHRHEDPTARDDVPQQRERPAAPDNAQQTRGRLRAYVDVRDAQVDTAADAVAEPLQAARTDRPVVEERKLVTVLDADLRGVRGDSGDTGSGPAYELDPEQARREISEWTAVLAEIVTRWGGAAQPLIGGGVIGLFGYPVAREDHAARALWAGDEILRRFPVPIRLGADTGEIIAAGPHEGALPQIGGAVLDKAARLRAAAAPGSFLAATRTGQAANRHGTFRFADVNKAGQRLVSASRLADEPGDEPPMVGRAAELEAVLSLVDAAAAGRSPRLITVSGPAGIGKTRLVQEVIGRRPKMRVVKGRCLAAGDGITYWALGEILREACGISLGDSGDQARLRLTDGLASLVPQRTIFALATTAGIRLPGNPLDNADPRDVDDELGRAWPRLATALAVREPLLLVVEDLHWAGTPLITTLTRLVARAEGPVVVMTTTRPEYEHPRPADVVSLRALSEDDGRALLKALPHRISPQNQARILARADGNPYFLGQLAAHVAEGGRGSLPDTLHALLAARVDALPAAEKEILQRAAVIGRTFWATPLRAEPGHLEALENRGLIRARPASTVSGEDEYAFQHALLRDVAYAGLPRAQRATGHARASAWLEEVARERVGEVIELVAVHYAAAADGPEPDDWIRGKAFRSLIAAGVSARRRFAVRRALDLHRKAIPYAANRAERAEAIEAIGDDHETAYAGDEAIAAWREAITALPKDDRRARLCLKTAQMVVARWGGFRTPADPALGDRVVDEGLAAVTDPSTKAQLLALRALCGGRWAWTGRPDPVAVASRRRAATDACTLADRIGSAPLRAMALLGVAAVHFLQERYEEAVDAVLEEVALVEQDGRDRDRALGHTVACLVVGGVRGDYELALWHALRSYEWARTLSPHDRLHGTAAVLICLEQLGRDAEIDTYLEEHLSLRQGPVAEMACPYIRSGPLVGALVLARRGEPERAKEVAATVALDLDHPGNAEVLRARLALQFGDVATARSLAERLMSMNRRPGPEEIPHEALAMLQALEAAGDHTALRAFLPRARAAAKYLALLTPACDHAESLGQPGTGPPPGR